MKKHSPPSWLRPFILSVFLAFAFGPASSPQSVPPGFTVIEGDILVPPQESTAAYVPTARFWYEDTCANTADPDPNSPIQTAVVNYVFDANVTAQNRQRARTAMQDWEAVANVSFVEAKAYCPRNSTAADDSAYILIRDSSADQCAEQPPAPAPPALCPVNNSQLGRWIGGGYSPGGPQHLNLANWDWHFVIMHELGHALGYWHEQSRSDRNDFIQINRNNVDEDGCPGGPTGPCVNFDPRTDGGEIGPYNFASIMHYSASAFASGGPTIEVLKECNVAARKCENGALAGGFCTTDDDCDPLRVGVCKAGVCTAGRVELPCSTNADCDLRLGNREYLSALDGLVMSLIYQRPEVRILRPGVGSRNLGTFTDPYRSWTRAMADTPAGNTLFVRPGNYSAAGTWSRQMTIIAVGDEVILDK